MVVFWWPRVSNLTPVPALGPEKPPFLDLFKLGFEHLLFFKVVRLVSVISFIVYPNSSALMGWMGHKGCGCLCAALV